MPPFSRAINTFFQKNVVVVCDEYEKLVLMVLELVHREGYDDGPLGIDCPGGRH